MNTIWKLKKKKILQAEYALHFHLYPGKIKLFMQKFLRTMITGIMCTIFLFMIWMKRMILRLTYNLRANNPSVSHDGKKIVFLFQKDGTTNLGSVDIDGKNFKRLTFFENGEQVYNPKYSPDDSYVIFDYSYANTRDIAKVSV